MNLKSLSDTLCYDDIKIAKAIIQLIDVVHFAHENKIAHGNINNMTIVLKENNDVALDSWCTPV